MSDSTLGAVRGARPGEGDAPLDLTIGAGLTVLLANDEERLVRYLQMMAGVIPATQGEVTLLGASPSADEYGGRALRRRVGYVTPHAPLLSVLDGVRNVMLPALYHLAVSEQALLPQVQRLLEQMGGGYDHRVLPAFMPELQQRLLLLARALILEPGLLFIEQPLLGLDNRSRVRLRDYILTAVAPRVRALVVASNDPVLAGAARQVVFIGAERHWVFANWTMLRACAAPEVQEFVEREQHVCSAFED